MNLVATPPADYDSRDMNDTGVRLRFHRNETAIDAPEHVLRAIRALGAQALRTYPVEEQALLARTFAQRLGVDTKGIVLANGADELLLSLGRAFLAPGDEALLVTPTFGMYERAVCLVGGIPRTLPYAQRWRFDVKAFAALATPRTRLAILGNPNNPTGEALDAAALEFLARSLPYVTIVVDEVYLALSDRSLWNVARSYDNVVVIASLSKTAGLAGLRVGYAIGAPQRAAAIRRTIAPYPLGIASIVAAQAFLDDWEATLAYQTRLSAQVDRSLAQIVSALRPYARDVWRGEANFALFDFGDAAEGIVEGLSAQGISVRRYDNPALAGMIRICASDDASTAELIDAVKSLVAQAVRA